MNLGELKPLLTTLVLPPAGPLLLVLAGLWAVWRRRRALSLSLLLLGSSTLWLLSCNAVAVLLGQRLLPAVEALAPDAWSPLKTSGVQAVVVLGGGVVPAPEYAQAQPNSYTSARLRYGVQLARAAGLPLAFAGGVGWAAAGTDTPSEASTAARWVAETAPGMSLRWLDADSRDTAENAARLKTLLQADGVQHIALVTNAWHLPRSQRHFEQAGFKVLPAPMGFVVRREAALLEWLPSAHGLTASRQVLREWLALQLLPS